MLGNTTSDKSSKNPWGLETLQLITVCKLKPKHGDKHTHTHQWSILTLYSCLRLSSYNALCILCLGMRKTKPEAVVMIYFLKLGHTVFTPCGCGCVEAVSSAARRVSSHYQTFDGVSHTETLWITMAESGAVLWDLIVIHCFIKEKSQRVN